MNLYVIGGGPAGIAGAISAADSGARVTLLEQNEKLGKKLYISGKGRCNVTNNTTPAEFLKSVISNPKFLFGALKYSPEYLIDFFEDKGLKLKTERGNRVFPASDKSVDILKVLNKVLSDKGVAVVLNCKVLSLEKKDGIIVGINTTKGHYSPDKVLLATGGITYPATGSTGDGFTFAKTLGHSIIPLRPSLCGIRLVDEEGFSLLEGLSLKNVTAKILSKSRGKVLFEDFGEMLFTGKGVSGPIILSLSSRINRLDCKDLVLSLDLKPALSDEVLDKRLTRDFLEFSNKDLKNSLFELLPSSIIPFIINRSGISPHIKTNTISKAERVRLGNTIKNLSFDVLGLEDIKGAIVTAGGIDVKEINPKTMQSKLIDNLYFAGEIIDVDALTGGYNMQIAFSTGFLAGESMNTL